ncbi:DDHD domain-containing protein [Myxozyma melibiosi]|uniref:DDHD domain-containing protein n=1 Tax=Myxozyma melibiosi TaxID=54550 RepID=A0ABR1F6B7_9ASCO
MASSAAAKATCVDHAVPYRQRLSRSELPPNTPPLAVRWFFATDIPKTKPFVEKDWKPPKPPSKFVPFSATDSRNIEALYQRNPTNVSADQASAGTSIADCESELDTVAVNEDRLFKVDIRKRELSPIYWAGPTYDVRRGTWFYADSSTLKPCDENLANQIEEGYLKNQPFCKPVTPPSTATEPAGADLSVDKSTAAPTHEGQTEPARDSARATTQQPQSSIIPEEAQHESTDKAGGNGKRARTAPFTDSLTSAFTFRTRSKSPASKKDGSSTVQPLTETGDAKHSRTTSSAGIQPTLLTWPLYGPHMGKYVIYSTDASTAWIISDDFYGKFSSTIYQRLTAGASMGGLKIVRGWSNVRNKKSAAAAPTTSNAGTSTVAEGVASSSPPSSGQEKPILNMGGGTPGEAAAQLVEALKSQHEKEVKSSETEDGRDNKILEDQMEQDYARDEEEDDQNREIDHVVLCVHGIGQKLGQRLESVNFVGDVNTFRKTMKAVYAYSPDLQALNGIAGGDSSKPNSRIQVLPVCWRHNIHFGLKQESEEGSGAKEQDIGRMDSQVSEATEEEDAASLADITIDTVPALRGVISEVLLDILLYYQPAYRERIMLNVVAECNRIYRLFQKWNPTFNGRISIAGHSLGSAIAFDVLCRQPDIISSTAAAGKSGSRRSEAKLALEFEVDSFFGLGSPVGLFQMLKGKSIAPRSVITEKDGETGGMLSPLDYDLDNPFTGPSPYDVKAGGQAISRPRAEDIYNIFHPADPISYRLEPLVVKRMASLKPQPIPASRRGLNSQIANLAELTSRVAQSASNMWSSMASGLASTILNKSLGYETSGMVGEGQTIAAQNEAAVAAGANSATATTTTTAAGSVGASGSNSAVDANIAIETLYSRFQRESTKVTSEADAQLKTQRETELIHGLNYTGRIDFALPEGYMDITILSSLSSHLGYFKDEDVANFVMGQLLARPYPKRVKSERRGKR